MDAAFEGRSDNILNPEQFEQAISRGVGKFFRLMPRFAARSIVRLQRVDRFQSKLCSQLGIDSKGRTISRDQDRSP
jgi:hypothetical protein